MLYAVIPLQASEGQVQEIRKKLTHIIGIFVYEETLPDVVFVSYDGDTASLSQAIGFGDDESVGMGMILRVTHRNGYAVRTVWEWLDTHE